MSAYWRALGFAACASLCVILATSPKAADLPHSSIPLTLPSLGDRTQAHPSKGITAGPVASAWLAKRPCGPVGQPARSAEETLRAMRARLAALAEARRLGLTGAIGSSQRITPSAVAELARIKQANPRSLIVAWHESGSPRFLAGTDLAPGARLAAQDPVAMASAFLGLNRGLLQVDDPSSELIPRGVEVDRRGYAAVRLQQQYRGLEIWGRDAVVRVAPSGRVIGYSGQLHPTPAGLETTPLLGAPAARDIALTALSARDGVQATEEQTRLILYPCANSLRLAWAVTAAAGLGYRTIAFVDARTGDLLHTLSLVREDGPATGSGVDLRGASRTLGLWQVDSEYLMIDTRKPMWDPAASQMPNDPRGAIWTVTANHTDGSQLTHVHSADPNDWPANAVSATTCAGHFYDYLSDAFGRNSHDGEGRTLMLVVDYSQDLVNAFWNGNCVAIGNGDGQQSGDLAGALDVVGHELGHAVVGFTAGLVYEFQSGAMDEHFADVFGALLEFEVDGAQADWLMAEDVWTPGTPGDCMRDMENPASVAIEGLGQPYPDHMDDYFELTAGQDHGGVHINNMIPSRAFVIVATAIGRDKAAQIWYRALTQFLNRNSQFIDLRLAAVQSAADLYGADSAEQQAVEEAFDTVGIIGGSGTADPPALPDNEGDDFVAACSATMDYLGNLSLGHIFRIPPDWSGGETPVDISQNAMGEGGRPSFSDDGQRVTWVAADKNIYFARSDGTERMQLSTGTAAGIWWSVALSADARYLAAKTEELDGRVFIFDILEPENSDWVMLYAQNDGGQTNSTVAFVDVMEFSVAGDYLLYDAVNQVEVEGEVYEYWDINLLRLSDRQCFRLFQSLPRGESIGNPTFAQNKDHIIAFDYMDATGHIYCMACDTQDGTVGVITDNQSSLGRPAFSGDDTQVYYQFGPMECNQEPGGMMLWKVTLEEDGLTGSGDDSAWLCPLGYPVWFTIGDRPAPVLLQDLDAFWAGSEAIVRWQVAAPSLFTGFDVERAASPAGPFEQINADPIPTMGSESGIFSYTDPAPVASAELFYSVYGIRSAGARVALGTVRLAAGGNGQVPRFAQVRSSVPSPLRGRGLLRFTLPLRAAGMKTEVAVFDITGRQVALPSPAAYLSPGEHALEWQALDPSGRPLATGEYYLRVRMGSEVSSGVVSIVR